MKIMATAGSSDDSVLSTGGELHCEPCLSDGRTRTVEGFCMECDEYLCQSCLDTHRILRVTKTHHVKRGESLPGTKPNKQAQYCTESYCNFHTDKKITYFCQSHQQLCCDQCVILGHRRCTDVKSIDDYSQELMDSKDFKTTVGKLKSLQSTYTAKINDINRKLEDVDVYYQNAIETFKSEVDKIKMADIEKLKAIIASYECILRQLAAWFDNIDTCTNNKQNKELVVLVFGTKREVDAIEDNVKKLCKDDSIVRYGFVQDNTSLPRLIKAPFLVKTFNVKHERDENTCYIADIAMLKENLILVTDYINSSLKIFNSDTNTIVSYVKLQYQPWQMSVTEKGEVYVTLNDQPKLLHLVSPATDLATFQEIDVDGKCYAVECFNKTLNVLCASPAKALEVDENGKLVRIISNDLCEETIENGTQFVSNPRWSTQDPETGSMYVSCNVKSSITEITSDGQVKLFVRSDQLDSPQGLCMDNDGSILVCRYHRYNNNVYRVKRNGDIQSVLPQYLGYIPHAVALDKSTKWLYVGGESNELRVFQV
ncbi:uncharacterized protein LOC128218571 [Mya arenaria]|uniref:uncharacterized protein LOC128218571 n=1 Tax=Mya arenaria TaxID=6604 RepID=UPI0022E7C64C|nr:uncharacterized protein LOC128218571 [Mya arenaria]